MYDLNYYETNLKNAIDLTFLLGRSHVYFLVDGREIVYIGQSSSVGSRIQTHTKRKQFDRVLAIDVPKDKVIETEAALIRIARPKLNTRDTRMWTERERELVTELGLFDLAYDTRKKIHWRVKRAVEQRGIA